MIKQINNLSNDYLPTTTSSPKINQILQYKNLQIKDPVQIKGYITIVQYYM